MITIDFRPAFARTVRRIFTLSAAIAAVSAGAADLTWKNIQFGGFASQGYLLSSSNDYLGDTSDGTFDFREYAVNASWAKGKFRVGAQAFGQKLGAYGDDKIKLDWATIDYQPTQWLGFRAGRVKMPRGLYNEALDIDAVRPFVLLPQGVYDARLRDFNAAFNGAMLFGNIELRRAGSLDYRVFYGDIPIDVDSGAADYFNNDMRFPTLQIGMDAVRGGSVMWNTPVAGLRTGYSYSAFKDMNSTRMVTMPSRNGLIDSPFFKHTKTYERHLASVEWSAGAWTFAVEAGKEHAVYDVGPVGVPAMYYLNSDSEYAYVSAARRVHRRVELGCYASYSSDKQAFLNIVSPLPVLTQRDYAASVRFDVNDHLLLKLEGHYLNGSGKLFDTVAHPQPLEKRDNSWTMLAAKVTYVF